MKKILFLICFITLFGCSKSETIPSLPSSTLEVSHISNDDLALVDGYVQLIISEEEAIKRGVPASEYNLISEQLTQLKENKNRFLKKDEKDNVHTKSELRYTIAWGILYYKDQDPQFISYNISPTHNFNTTDGIVLFYSFTNPQDDYNYHKIDYIINGSTSLMGYFYDSYNSSGSIPFPDAIYGSIKLEYTFLGSDVGVCVYQVDDYIPYL